MAETLFVDSVRANGYAPTADTRIIIFPQNKTFTNSTITLNFIAEEAFRWFNFFYSVDGQKIKAIENMTTISEADLNAGKNPTVYVKTLRGSFVLSNLSEGWHNVTVYQIGDYPAEEPQNGEVIHSANAKFLIAIPPQPEPFPTTFVIASIASVSIIGAGVLFYLAKKRRHLNFRRIRFKPFTLESC